LFVDPAEEETRRIKHHTVLGYELLRQGDDPDILSPHVAYEHHEHQDGTGLPRGLVGSNHISRNREVSTPIPTLIGEIAAVANEYDNLLSGAHGKPSLTPDLAIESIIRGSGTRFNRDIVQAFRRVAPLYPQGTEVLLSGGNYDGCHGVVSRVNSEHLDRPRVLLLRDKTGQRIEPVEIDMVQLEETSLRIVGL